MIIQNSVCARATHPRITSHFIHGNKGTIARDYSRQTEQTHTLHAWFHHWTGGVTPQTSSAAAKRKKRGKVLCCVVSYGLYRRCYSFSSVPTATRCSQWCSVASSASTSAPAAAAASASAPPLSSSLLRKPADWGCPTSPRRLLSACV